MNREWGLDRRWDVAFAIVLAAVFAWSAYQAQAWSEIARTFPLAVALPGAVLALLALVLPARAVEDDEEPEPMSRAERLRRTGVAAGWIGAFFLAVYMLGFLVAIPLATVAYLRLAGGERWPLTAAIAGGCWAVVFGLFDRVLHVPLPPGELLKLLGIG